MNRLRWTLAGWVLFLSVFAFARATLDVRADESIAPKTAAPATIEDLAWLAGSWKGKIESHKWESSYTTPEGGIILSASKEFRGDRVVMIEFECFKVIDGVVTLTPYPFGKESDATFPLSEFDRPSRRAVFANPDHDFPKEITYHRSANDRLQIRIKGEQGGKEVELNIDLSNGAGGDNE